MRRSGAGDSEFVFELRVCAWAERNWPPAGDLDSDTVVLVARQLGTRSRRWDTIVIEADRAELEQRARFGPDRLDSDLLHVLRDAPTEWAYYREALPDPGYPWRYVREAIHRAADRGILETRKRGNRIEIRRRWPYPEWAKRVIAIENKPDLDAGAARVLSEQLQHDVALALADEVWVATRATDERLEPILFETIPTEAGVLAVSEEEIEVLWHPRRLAVEDPGTEITERPTGRQADRSAACFEYTEPATKRETRRAVAERAYERGWRAYVESMRPDCRHFSLRRDQGRGDARENSGMDAEAAITTESGAPLPYCEAKDRHQSGAECSSSCPEFEPEPPTWRSGGWPIEGGPGAAVKRLLAERRQRRRPGLDRS
ncbi:hypothetical protein BRC86_12950 [Halobacteriales archaeon QS_3_64_16]|nr:MAG: hypothetical protein BRC86_12950 [Halobacteriales archaeon QS_3_64_16]